MVEGAALESLAVNGGAQALFALMELVIAIGVLWIAAARPWAAVLLAGWTAAAAFLASRYVVQRRRWTIQRMQSTHRLLESIAGHRTRAIQQPPDRVHMGEDELLERYIRRVRDGSREQCVARDGDAERLVDCRMFVLAADVVPGAATRQVSP